MVRAAPPARRHPMVRWLIGTRPLSWLAALSLHHLDGAILRLSRGRWPLSGVLTGLPVATLFTTGARSGQQRQTPVLALPDGTTVVVIASNFGQRRHPAWYHNLRAQPRVTLLIGGRAGRFVAREATEAERGRYWRLADAIFPGYAIYRRRVATRRIPIVVLTPEGAAPPDSR